MRKTLFSLVLLLLAGLYSANAQNYYYHITVPSGQGLYFVINSDGTSVSVVNPLYIMGWGIEGYSPAPSGNLTIPPSITIHDTNYTVTAIDYGAFYGCDSLTSVNIPNTVTSIESSAFRYCTNLVSVSIPNSVTTIGENAFRGCTGITTVNYNADSCTSSGGMNSIPFCEIAKLLYICSVEQKE